MRRERREGEKNKEEKGERESSLALTPTPPLVVVVFFSARMSLRYPHDLNAWNRLIRFGFGGNRQQQLY